MTRRVQQTEVVIIGAGFSGMCMAIKLQEAGIRDIRILEKAREVGGTWRENTYPGAECDVPSALYSYSFEQNARWQYKWAEQPQILHYQQQVARKHGLYEATRFGAQVSAARFDEHRGRWRVETTDGERYECRFLIAAVGQLHHPNLPAIPGQELFQGPQFHSARWDHGVDLSGKRVAVIGNAASALQFIPEIAPQAAHLTVFQRSANWVVPKRDRPYRPWEQWLADRVPLITRLYRLRLWLRGELLLYPAMRRNRLARWLLRTSCLRYLKREIRDPALVAKLIPDYPVGARRILFSDNYYQALARDNVTLCTAPIERISATGIVTRDGGEIPCDAIIYGTGFRTNPFLAPMDIRGRGGRALGESWAEGAHAYLGIATHGFPNLYLLYGPNTNLGHNSIIIMIEAQVRYIVQCIEHTRSRQLAALDVRPDVEARYNAELQARLREMAFAEVDHSWYMDRGRITNNWAGSTWEYMRRLHRVRWEDFEEIPAPAGELPAVA